jgi:hypothetical protein
LFVTSVSFSLLYATWTDIVTCYNK